ncbi:MAG: glycosyltransferase family 4 protein [Tissierellaceae bacterium]
MKKKVCHITSSHGRYDTRIFLKQCKSLVKYGYDVMLLVNDDKEDEIVDGVKIISTKFKPVSRRERFLNSKKKLFEMAIKIDADIYTFHDPELLLLGYRLKKAKKVVIFDSHENYPEQILIKNYIPIFLRKIVATLYKKIETEVCMRLDAVLFPNSLNGKHVFERRTRITEFIENFPLLEEFKYSEYISDLDKKDTVLYIGSITEARGITTLVKSVYMANAKLILAGKFQSQKYYDELKELTEYSCVEYKGVVNRKEVVNIINKSKIGVAIIRNIGQYNKYDGFPTKVYEYMLMGLPVIISKYDYSYQVFKENNCGICVDPENIDEIVKSITFLLNNPEQAKLMGDNGKRLVKERYNWDLEEKKLVALYNKLID